MTNLQRNRIDLGQEGDPEEEIVQGVIQDRIDLGQGAVQNTEEGYPEEDIVQGNDHARSNGSRSRSRSYGWVVFTVNVVFLKIVSKI